LSSITTREYIKSDYYIRRFWLSVGAMQISRENADLDSGLG